MDHLVQLCAKHDFKIKMTLEAGLWIVETPLGAKGGKALRPHSLPGRSCGAEEGGDFELVETLGLEPLGLGKPHSLLEISGGADRGGFGQALGSFAVRGLGSLLWMRGSHLLGRI